MILKKKLSALRRRFLNKTVVLCYHRIATPEVDSWELCVSQKNFEEQLQVIKELGLAISVAQLVENLQNRQIKNNVVVTFDDGYIDNFKTAAPLLSKYSIPATFFITSRNIGLQKEFWWDELESIMLFKKELPQHFSMQIGTGKVEYDLMDEVNLDDNTFNKHKVFCAYYEPLTRRADLYFKIWQQLFSLEQKQQEELMSGIRTWAGANESCRPEYFCMTETEVKHLSQNPLFTIAGHTHTHPSLRHLSRQRQLEEISENSIFLNSITGQKVESIAYPSGSFNDETISVLKEIGFTGAFTTQQKAVINKTDVFRIGRMQAVNCDGETFKIKLQKWLRH